MAGRNQLQGLEVRSNLLTEKKQKSLLAFVDRLVEQGRAGKLRGKTFLKRSKTKAVISFGVWENPDPSAPLPGADRTADVERVPAELCDLRQFLASKHCFPVNQSSSSQMMGGDSVVIHTYGPGDYCNPTVPNYTFVGPYVVVNLGCDVEHTYAPSIVSNGVFDGPFVLPVAAGAVITVDGNSKYVRQAVPAMSGRRVTITFRQSPRR